MKHRKLRIAWSVTWGMVAVLLIVLWVRSCYTSDGINIPIQNGWYIGFGTFPGACAAGIQQIDVDDSGWRTFDADALRQSVPQSYAKYYTGTWGRFEYINELGPGVIVPNWFLILVAVALSAAPWIKWSNRFTLRTLLIATTLVAVVLGLIVSL